MSPIIGFTEKDLLRGQILPPAWYRVKIDAVGEKLSKDGNSTNYPVEGTILFNADDGSTTYHNFPLDWNFNSKALGFAVGFLKSLGLEVNAGTRYDLSATAGKEIDVFVENDLYEGRTVNRVNHKYRAPRS
jgi:hypothetical protein